MGFASALSCSARSGLFFLLTSFTTKKINIHEETNIESFKSQDHKFLYAFFPFLYIVICLIEFVLTTFPIYDSHFCKFDI